jgi:uncharacterized protein (TIGR00251 family)
MVFFDTPSGAAAVVRVTPRAGRTGLAGVHGDVLLVRLAAPPVEGAANDALVRFVSELLDVPRRDIAIVSGERGRTKRLVVAGRPASALNGALAPLLSRG